jgi:hypothetical protein
MTLYGLEFPAELCDSNGSNGCDCAELLDSKGKRRPPFPGHDCDYVRRRSALVAEAIKIADETVRTKSPSEDNALSRRSFV